MTDEVAVLERARLDSLRWHWGSAYEVSNPAPGRWVARRHSNGTVLTARSDAELRQKIRADYR